MRKFFHNPQRTAGAAMLAFALAVLWANGGESFRPKTVLADGFPLTAATPARGASWKTPVREPSPEPEFADYADYADDLPAQPAPVAFAVTDTLTVAAGGLAIAGFSLLRTRRPK